VLTLAEWCRERNAPQGTTRRVYDVLFPTAARAGLYRLMTTERSGALERALRARGVRLAETTHA
jgi:hypothetical protein